MNRWTRWKGWSTRTATQAVALLIVVVIGALLAMRTPGRPEVWAEAQPPFEPATPIMTTLADSIAAAYVAPIRPVRAVGYRKSAVVEAALSELRTRHLRLPIPSLTLNDLHDSFEHPRGGGTRRHLAIDIPAPRGTPVLSVDDGVVIDLKSGGDGGTALVATDRSRLFVYYYAHLQGYHSGVEPGHKLARGDTIGFVGTSGNAPEDRPHLHFAIVRSSNLARWSAGTPINPVAVWQPVRRAEQNPN